MVVKEYENAEDYLNDFEASLLENEAVSQLVLYDAYQDRDRSMSSKGIYGVIMDDDRVLLHFSNSVPNNMAIYVPAQSREENTEAAVLLADYIISNHIPFEGLYAKYEICQSFIEQYKNSINCTFIEKMGMDIMEIRQVNEIKPVDGKSRLAVQGEEKLITEWMVQFQIEALASEIDYESALEKATQLIRENKLYVFEDTEQKIVSMAAATRKLAHGIAINYVFTPEEFRGMGYAAANVYYISKEILENGAKFCTLFVDKKNPLSNRAYEKVGFCILDNIYEYKLLLS